jgi:hypothetical protein
MAVCFQCYVLYPVLGFIVQVVFGALLHYGHFVIGE